MVTTFAPTTSTGNVQTVAPPILLAQLLTYVAQQAKEIDLNGFKLAANTGFLQQKKDIADLPGILFNQSNDSDPVWLRVDRLISSPAPKVQLGTAGKFIKVSQDSGGPGPSIDDVALNYQVAILNDGGSDTLQSVEADKLQSSVLKLLAQYTPIWNAWAIGDRPRQATIRLYGDLFDLKLQLESQKNELVWGIGVTAWKLLNGTVDFQYPLLTQAMEIAIEDRTLAILLRPCAVEPRLEFDAFFAAQIPTIKAVSSHAKQALAISVGQPITPFDVGTFEPILKSVAGNLDPRGRYSNGQDKAPVTSNDLLVTDAWVLMSRRRSNNFLIDDAERLQEHINDGRDIPGSALALVTAPGNTIPNFQPVSFRGLSGLSSSGGFAADGAVSELYFPQPYNHEQVAIVEQLERFDGVAVQGPPGTGKTYTIANIVCHYLAMGKKVLVTSKGEQALEVLRSKIPESVRPLTVALLSGDHAGMQDFQSSISAISHELTLLNIAVVDSEIKKLLIGIDSAHSELATIDNRVSSIAATQLSDIDVDGVSMQAQKMADLVVTGNGQYGWFDDVLTLDASNAPPPASAVDFAGLRDSRRRLGPDVLYAAAKVPLSSDMLPSDDIGELHDVLVSMKAIDELKAHGRLIPLRSENSKVLDDVKSMLAAVKITANLVRELEDTGEVWPFELRNKCRSIKFTTERNALEALFVSMDALKAARAEFMFRPIVVPEAAIGLPKFREAITRAIKSGKPLAMFGFGAGDIKRHLGSIRVAGLLPSGPDDWMHVQRYVALHDELVSFSARWNEFAKKLSIPMIQGGVQALDWIVSVSVTARKAHLLAIENDAALTALAERVFVDPPIALLMGGALVDLLAVGEHLKNHLTHARLSSAAIQLAALKEKIADTSGPISRALKSFCEKELGNKQQSTTDVRSLYTELVQEVVRVESLKPDLQTVNMMADSFKRAGAVKLAHRLRNEAVAAVGDDTIFPVSWREAWNWARIKSHLDNIEARTELLHLAGRRRELETGLAKLYENIVAKSAWRSAKAGATPKVLSALAAYTAAMGKIGKGTGPNAPRFRRDARVAMENARGAVPCWIMTHAKVSETLPAELGSFDLVIVDEASQSDIWALPAVLRGKKVLVVGDDKQVSPDGGFVAAAHVQALRNQFLSNQPFASVLTLGMSLYDLASTVFAAHKVVLHEHFRCVPAIIAYSNKFYGNSLKPLRISKQSERIDPPLVDIYVPSGNEIKKVNRPEAEAIAAEITAILLDKKLSGRTLGVVSLLGAEQAKYIDTLVRSRCDAAELMLRKFKCGNAPFFQGSERDIMFLSMVVDAKACTALSGNMYDQRFNVAASRARDRMYLVRSVTLSDLSPLDIRAGLLQHFNQPTIVSVDGAKSLIAHCESPFEREVYSELFDIGYRVIPQVNVGAFRIDMVVEGENDARLAIECDGDSFHGPDQWSADMNRQRILERAGWTFWRCFASTWTLRKDEILSELISRLDSMGIAPLGTLVKLPSLVEYRQWQPSPSDTRQNLVVPVFDANVQVSEYEDLTAKLPSLVHTADTPKNATHPTSDRLLRLAVPDTSIICPSQPHIVPAPVPPVRTSKFTVGTQVNHKSLGPGVVVEMNGQFLTVNFPFKKKELELATLTAGDYLVSS
ncbi:DNA helicase [Polaromonas sp. CG9_12]|nr:DNA helicase [Polaromonas sp. CG9_12]